MLNESLETSPRLQRRLPNQRWQIYPSYPQLSQELATLNNISPIIAQLLINRGLETPENAQIFLNPDSLNLPSPFDDFPDLAISVELLENAIANNSKIAICGDYDADGMTSTALLLRSLRALGANVDYAIPSRMKDGYGINNRIVQEFYDENVQLILTVDNGISAFEPINKAKELGLKIIITDHHDIPPKLPPADAILNPKLINESSPYRGIAGVGVAYILAVSIAQQLGEIKGLVAPLLSLFTLGTIADLAPLTGVNRRWVKRGLKYLPKCSLPGIQALIQVAGVQSSDTGETNLTTPNNQHNNQTLKPEDIGFKLGPRINAIGRIGDPQIVIDLLTTDDLGIALTKAMQCEQTNSERQRLCEEIEQEAIAIVEELYVKSLPQDRVLLIIKENWHHGVIGIVASRLLERYGVPVFIATYEHDHIIRGSARGIPEFHVFQALQFCDDLLGKYGGHQAAGGFSLPANNLDDFRLRLSKFANQCLEIHHLKPLLKIDTQINLHDINYQLYQELNVLHPCGIDNPDPIFSTNNVHVLEQQLVGKGHIKAHIKFTVVQENKDQPIQGIFWRSRDYFPLPPRIDIAYKLRENNYNGKISVELELIGFKLPDYIIQLFSHPSKLPNVKFEHHQTQYSCGIYNNGVTNELRIKNSQGKVLVMQPGEKTGLLGLSRENAKQVNLSQPQYDAIIQAALQALLTAGNE
ncbi:single-stranded-DNA-specific exonuclease RecJ [Anabaena sp. FACHB-1237]|uniref:single-stranded-DNA-specific exonuclease RecJ n=1 Tax=Anabaena sp. FACHB-1237 TaxID=2692769 RepID=UPI001680C118|nr:single-stranded-DNA-specific exonuclease RecJ [Anabaena sp. FACHB-1237]MBD2136210.1 single-stranded-DNA-specific exonuclease RecJ [Anabaena sp. FACHB-1237]